MEEILDVYQRRYDAKHVLICMDEASRQILSDLFEPLPMRPGTLRRIDDKYERHGVRNLLMFYNPIDGLRRILCRDSRTRQDWAEAVLHMADVEYPEAEMITLVCDNLNTHDVASFYHAFDAETAGRLRRKVRLVHTPKNGSWLNMAEMELSILSRQCIGTRRFGCAEELDSEVSAWEQDRNNRRCGTDWRFTTADARLKLKSLYPKPDILR